MSEHIFIADDDPDIVQFVSVNLELEGYDVSSATDGKSAACRSTGAEIVQFLEAFRMSLPTSHSVSSRLSIAFALATAFFAFIRPKPYFGLCRVAAS